MFDIGGEIVIDQFTANVKLIKHDSAFLDQTGGVWSESSLFVKFFGPTLNTFYYAIS